MEEKRLIDANLIVSVAENAYGQWNLAMAAADGKREISLVFKMQELCKAVKAVAENAPTVDAVEVVRCKDCKHRGTDYCIFHIKGEPADEELLRKLDNDFCSYGERNGGDGVAWKEKDGG